MAEKVVIFRGYWQPQDLDREPHAMFIFGDNSQGIGKKGQAIIRDRPNAFGIPTQETWQKYYNEANYLRNITQIDQAIRRILVASPHYEKIYFPEAGLGTGLAQLATRSPSTWAYLNQQLLLTFGLINGSPVTLIKELSPEERVALFRQEFTDQQIRLLLAGTKQNPTPPGLIPERTQLVEKMNAIFTGDLFTGPQKVRILTSLLVKS